MPRFQVSYSFICSHGFSEVKSIDTTNAVEGVRSLTSCSGCGASIEPNQSMPIAIKQLI
jgi:hypothetical protein